MATRRLSRTVSRCASALAIAAAVALAVAGFDKLDTGAAQQPVAAASRLPRRLPTLVIRDSFPRRIANGSITRDGKAPAGIAIAERGDDTRKSGLRETMALSSEPGPHADPTLAGAALGDPDPAIREEAIHIVAERGGVIALPTLQQALQDPSPRVREATIRALVVLGGTDAVSALGSALGAGDTRMRLSAVDALGEIGGPEALRLLEPASRDEDSIVREAAAQWLAELSGT